MAVHAPPEKDLDGQALLGLIEEVAAELRSGRRAHAGLDSKLEADLGLDSLARIELLLRIQRRFGVALGERQALGAETPRQLLSALSAARGERPAGAAARAPAAAPALVGAPPPETATLLEALRWYLERDPDRVHIELLESGDDPTPITYRQLDEEARRVAAGLGGRGLARGESVALMLPTGRDFFVSFLGILMAGGVPVPIYPPFRMSQLEDHLSRQARVLENARAVLLVASPETAPAAHWLRNRLPDLRAVVTAAQLASAGGHAAIEPRADDVALVQYTSGSTGDPKGVVLTHANLLANIRAIGQGLHATPADVVVTWLPLYHDMGLIGAWLGSLYHGCKVVVLPPTRFLAQPSAWLWAIHRHRGTLSAAPNFAYEICASKLPDAELAGLDLSSWRCALNGAEPVSPGTLERFTRRFAQCGFQPGALMPVFGLAENAVALTFTPPGRGPRVERLDRDAFERDGRAVPADATAPSAVTFVGAGMPVLNHEVRVVDELGREVADRQLGRVQFRGPSSTRGYLRNEAATKALFDGAWLLTGDLGYIADGELFVTGRSKDMIIRAGRNIFPYDLEEAVAGIPGIRRGGVAVFAVRDDARGTEALVVVAETAETNAERQAELRAQVDARAAALLGAAPDEIRLVPPRTVPKTSSGKTRRAACRELYLSDQLGAPRSVRRQVLGLVMSLWGPVARRAVRATGALAYAAWFWVALGLLSIPAWLIAAALPGERACRRVVAAFARAFFAVAGAPVSLQGREHLARRPCVLVLNHASNMDGLAAFAVLPPGFSIVAKRELADNPLLRRPLRRLGVVLVERFDRERAAQEVTALDAELRAGRSLLVFPEGTNRRIPGVFPFHLGAFSAAARAGAPVVCGGIAGTRTLLRADQWFPRRARVTVVLHPPLPAAGDSWDSIVALRDRARVEVATASGEHLAG